MKLPRLTKPHTSQSESVASDGDAAHDARFPVLSPNPATNLLIAEIVVRGLANVMRSRIGEGVAKASYESDERAQEVIDGRGALTSLALYGAARLASRSPVGLGIVASGLIVKTLYDRGKQVQERRRRNRLAQDDPPVGPAKP